MDVKKPHWTWVKDILGLYRSTIIYSNAEYKLITDRGDLPTRQVFHSGNMVPELTQIRLGGDPIAPNEVKVEFTNESRDYEREVFYLHDSLSVFTNNQPIKGYELQLFGITRPDEAKRTGDLDLQRRRKRPREVEWTTALEAVAVEPGDVAVVGIPFTNFEAGIGGRALDGSSTHVLLDREFDQQSGYTYDLWLWHTQADTPEQRSVASGTGVKISVAPNSGFNYAVAPNDRYAIGISSEDLLRVIVTNVVRDEMGRHKITGEEYTPRQFRFECPGSFTPVCDAVPQAPPTSTTVIVSGCTLCVNMTFVDCQGGILTLPSTDRGGLNDALFLQPTHNPCTGSLINARLVMVSGPGSGDVTTIRSWSPANSYEAFVTGLTPSADSGDSYYINFSDPATCFNLTTSWGYISVYANPDASSFQPLGLIQGNSGCINIQDIGEWLQVRAYPVSNRGLVNSLGVCTFSIEALGCKDLDVTSGASSLTGIAEQKFWEITIPGCTVWTRISGGVETGYGLVEVHADGFLNYTCDPDASRSLKWRLSYGSSQNTIADSAWFHVNNDIGAGRPFTLRGDVVQGNPTDFTVGQRGSISYTGPQSGNTSRWTGASGTGSADNNAVQKLTMWSQFTGVNSDCFSVVFLSMETSVSSWAAPGYE